MSNKTLYADIFMYPNSLQVCEDSGFYGHNVQNATGLQVCFQSWIISDDCSNWGSDSHPEVGRFSDRIPVSLFMGKREGDQVELEINGYKIIVTLSQLKYKYACYGKFEDSLYDLTKSFGGICSEKYFTHSLEEKSQAKMLYENHKAYSQSLGFEVVKPESFRYYNENLNFD